MSHHELYPEHTGMRQVCPGGILYTIQPGDTVWQLSRRFGTTVDTILAANPGLDPQNLQIGQRICIPGTQPGPTDSRAVLLSPTPQTVGLSGVVLLSYFVNRATAVITNVPDPSVYPDARLYVIWLRRPDAGYRSARMQENPSGVYVGQVNTEDEPPMLYTQAIVTAEPLVVGAAPTGTTIATANLQ